VRTGVGYFDCLCIAIVAVLLSPSIAHAEDAVSTPRFRAVQVGAELGYAFPMGDLERGSEVADVVHGLVPLGLEFGYRFNRRVSLVLQGSYAIGIPTLCVTAGDCMASLGHDIRLGLGARFALPPIGPVLPQLRATFGYEWFRSELTDNGVTSGRSYRGPILGSLQAFGNLGSENGGVGPFAALSAGVFSSRELDTPAFTAASSVDKTSLHVWLEVGVRGSVAF
jgi:hypothetical protein